MTQVVLTLGGFDPTSGAGVCADIKTFAVHGLYAVAVITAVVVQNTNGVFEIEPLSPGLVKTQLECLKGDFDIKGIKISMVYKKEVAEIVRDSLKGFLVVFDPIIMSKNSFYLMKKDDIKEIVKMLFPISYMVTPNLYEAEFLSSIKIKGIDDMKKAAEKILELGPRAVLIKGGHLKGEEKIDLFYNGNEFYVFKKRSVVDYPVHGTGCAFSSSILANILKGYKKIKSIKLAKDYINTAILNSLKLGKGCYRIINHFYGEKVC